jgi:hypothetical protein
VYSQFYDDGYRLYNFDKITHENGENIQTENYFAKWGEYTIDLLPKVKKDRQGKE